MLLLMQTDDYVPLEAVFFNYTMYMCFFMHSFSSIYLSFSRFFDWCAAALLLLPSSLMHEFCYLPAVVVAAVAATEELASKIMSAQVSDQKSISDPPRIKHPERDGDI